MLPEIGKVFKLEVMLEQHPDNLFKELVGNMEQMGEWNPNVKQVKVRKMRTQRLADEQESCWIVLLNIYC